MISQLSLFRFLVTFQLDGNQETDIYVYESFLFLNKYLISGWYIWLHEVNKYVIGQFYMDILQYCTGPLKTLPFKVGTVYFKKNKFKVVYSRTEKNNNQELIYQ